MERFRTFDHTGDLGLEVHAPDWSRLFELAAIAVLAQVAEVPPGSAIEERHARVELEGTDLEDVFVAWLNAALLESELAGAIWTRARIEALSDRGVRGDLWGPARDARRQTFLREVKAVSHHALEVERLPDGVRARVVLDL